MLAFRTGKELARQISCCKSFAFSRISVSGFAKKTEEAAAGRDFKTPRLLKVNSAADSY